MFSETMESDLHSDTSSPSPTDVSKSPSIRNTNSTSSTPSPASTNSQSSTVELNSWPDNFNIPWSKFPHELKMAIAREQRPTPRDRRAMVRIVVDEMRLVELNPSRSDCLTVAKMIVKEHPKSFADILKDGTKIGSGYASLLNQLKTRVEHLNRDSMLSRRRRTKVPSSSLAKNSAIGPSDQYGCVRWQPTCPEGETEATLVEKQKQMKELYAQEGPGGAERGHLTQLMETTYYLQRKIINASPAPSIVELRTDWPYLFTLKELYNHFKLLTDISIFEKIDNAIKDRGKMIVQFFRQKPTNETVRQILVMFDATECTILGPCVVLLLMAHFKEKSDALILQVDVSVNVIYIA